MIFNISVLVYYMQLISSQRVDVSGPLLRRAHGLLLISSHHLKFHIFGGRLHEV